MLIYFDGAEIKDTTTTTNYFDTKYEKAIWGRGISLITGLFSLPIMINFSLHLYCIVLYFYSASVITNTTVKNKIKCDATELVRSPRVAFT